MPVPWDRCKPMSNPEQDALVARTIDHYSASAEAFWEGTKDHDVEQNRAALLDELEGDGPFAILDVGCGPGRDLAYFSGLGHEAVGVEGAGEMGRCSSRISSPSTCPKVISTAFSPMHPFFTCQNRLFPVF